MKSKFLKGIWKRFLSVGLSATLIAGSLSVGVMPVKAAETTTAVVNPYVRYQTMDGWGTSLCWFANIIGGWEEDFNDNGTPDREDIAELVFSPEYLNMNLVRYNIGGGENPAHDHMKRVEAMMPGWKESADAELDTTADANQLWFLDQANEYHPDDVINEVFSNSPPYWMTESQCATGAFSASKNNLKDDQYDEFADYLTDVTAWIDNHLDEKYGTGVDYIDPINEPDTSYWAAGSTKQEGCHFDPGESQSTILVETANALTEKGLTDVKVTGTDETSVEHAISSFKDLTDEAKDAVKTISTHTYGSAGREILSDLAASYDKELWMSEVCYGGSKHGTDSMTTTNASYFGSQILQDLKTLQSTTWVDWQVVDSEYECLKHDEDWGLIHAVFEEDGPVEDYHTNLVDANGEALEGVPEHGYWHITKQFYTLMQYSKYIKAGYTLVEISDDNMVAALSPDQKELVVVISNNSSNAYNANINLNALSNVDSAEAYRTSDNENCEFVSVEGLNELGNQYSLEVPKYSVTTVVISGSDDMVEEDGYINRVNSGVVSDADTVARGASDVNKFAYTGAWSRATNAGASYKADVQKTTEADSTVTFKFDGTRAKILGTVDEAGSQFTYTVDGGEAMSGDSYAETTAYGKTLVDTGDLEAGTHTVVITMTGESSADASTTMLCIDRAEVYNGTVADTSSTPVVTSAVAADSSAIIHFTEVEGADSYKVVYGVSENSVDWDKVEAGTASPITLSGLTNGITVYGEVVAYAGETELGVSDPFEVTPEKAVSDYLYYVNAGVSELEGVDPGQYQSNLEQLYGEDSTGRTWGLVADSLSDGSNAGEDIWSSVRTDNKNTVGEGLEYRFELEPGKYQVTIGALDPWSNGSRAEDFVVQGQTIATGVVPTSQITETCVAEVAEDENELVVEIVRAAGNEGEYEDVLVSWISIKEYEEGAIVSVENIKTKTFQGETPELPETVTVTKTDGSTEEAAVTWDLDGLVFESLYDYVTVKGSVEGTNIVAEALVYVIQGDLYYFVDTGTEGYPDTEEFTLVKNIFPGLLNTKMDQAYEEGSWGYIRTGGDAGWKESGDKYTSKVWCDELVYKLPLEAGDYTLHIGTYPNDWGTRAIQVTAEYVDSDGKTVVLADTGAYEVVKNEKLMKELKVELPEATELVVRAIEKGNDDVIFSWLTVSETVKKAELKNQVDEYDAVDTSIYTAESLAAFEAALAEAKDVLASEEELTDEAYDAALDALKAAYESLVVDTTVVKEVVSKVHVATTKGVQPTLPEKVTVKTYGGDEVEASVSWNSVAAKNLKKTYQTVTVRGQVAGSNLRATAKIEIIPENLVYFIDANGAKASSAYDAVVSANSVLRNEAADQAYEDGKEWGVVEGYAGAKDGDGTDKYTSAYYGKNTKGSGFGYNITLDKGVYNVTVGSAEYWSKTRTTIVDATYKVNGKEVTENLISGITVSGALNKNMGSGTLTITEDNTLVTLNAKAGTAQGAVVAFIGVTEDKKVTPVSMKLTAPAKTAYYVGDAIDLSGMKVEVTYDDESVSVIPAANCEITGFDTTTTGTKTVKVAYRGFEDTFTITVSAKPATPVTPGSGAGTQKPAEVTAVKLAKTKVTLGVKEKYQIEPITVPENAKTSYTYTTSNKKVATVSKTGKITAKKTGKANITVTSANGKKVVLKVTVKKAPNKITVTTKSKTLKKGKSFKIKYKLPKNTASNVVTFKSSNKKVATVDAKGKVKALKKGKATITVQTFNKKKAKIKITVK